MPRTAPQGQLQGGGMVPSCSGGGRDPPTISGPADTSVRMLRSASRSPAGAGVRCLYQGGSLLEGWQERTWSLPFHTATGRWELAFPHPTINTPGIKHGQCKGSDTPHHVPPQTGSWKRSTGAAGVWGSPCSVPSLLRRDQGLAVKDMCHPPLVSPQALPLLCQATELCMDSVL